MGSFQRNSHAGNGWLTLIFDHLSCRNGYKELLLAEMYKDFLESCRYMFFDSELDYAKPDIYGEISCELRQRLQEGTLLNGDGRYQFVFYDDIESLTEERLKEMLEFFLEMKRILSLDRPFEAHLFCVAREIAESGSNEVAFENMKKVVEYTEQFESVYIYLVICPLLDSMKVRLDTTVRWVSLLCHEKKSSVMEQVFEGVKFIAITSAMYDAEEIESTRKRIDELEHRIGDSSITYERARSILNENIEGILLNIPSETDFDAEHFAESIPAPKFVAGVINSIFNRTRAYTALMQLENAVNDSYNYLAHEPKLLNIFELSEEALNNIPPGKVYEWGERILKEFLQEKTNESARNKVNNIFKPRLGWKALRADITVYVKQLSKSSREQIPVIFAMKLTKEVNANKELYINTENEYKKELTTVRNRFMLVGGNSYIDTGNFLSTVHTKLKDNIGFPIQGVDRQCSFLIVNEEQQANFKSNYSSFVVGFESNNIYFIGESNSEVFQGFYIVGFNDVNRRMFRLNKEVAK